MRLITPAFIHCVRAGVRAAVRAAVGRSPGSATCLAVGLAVATSAGPVAAQGDPLHELARDLPKVEAPPELSALQEQKLGRAIKKLRNSNAAKRAETEDDVIAFGRGALPLLADAASTDHPGKMAGVARCLVELVDLRDRLFVAEAIDSEQLVMRRFAAEAAGKLGTDTLLGDLSTLLADADEVTATLAALSLTRNGDESALGVLVETYLSAEAGAAGTAKSKSKGSRSSRKAAPDTVDWTAAILDSLSRLHGAGPHQALLERLVVDKELERDDPHASSAVRLAAVKMLKTIGDEAAVRGLARGLEDHHNIVQQESINALRQLVENKPPFQGATFQQIKELERLKEVLKRWRGFDDG